VPRSFSSSKIVFPYIKLKLFGCSKHPCLSTCISLNLLSTYYTSRLNYLKIDKANTYKKESLQRKRFIKTISKREKLKRALHPLSLVTHRPFSSLRTDFPSKQFDQGWKAVGSKSGRQQREDPRDRLGRRERGRAATMIPGIEKRLTTAARIATQLLDYGIERRRFPPPPCPYLIPFHPSWPCPTVTRENGDENEGGLTTTRGTEMEKRAMRDRSKSFTRTNRDSCLISRRQSGQKEM